MTAAILDEELTGLSAAEAACARIAPLWPLQNFVAVNPFLGLSQTPFPEAAQLMDRVGHGAIVMDSAYYRRKLRDGAITAADIAAVLAGNGPADPVAWLDQQLQQQDCPDQLHTVAGWLDQRFTTSWESFVVDEISKWCSSYWDQGQSSWAMPWRDLPLYAAWKQAAAIDANPEVSGLTGFRAFVRQLPGSASAVIVQSLHALDVPPALQVDFLHRQLMSISGWSGHAAWRDRERLPELLAIRLAYDVALAQTYPGWRCALSRSRTKPGFTHAKYVALMASEQALRTRLLTDLRAAPPAQRAGRKALQAVFCIDVRSEVFRRALEAQSPAIATIGFAGFFGMAIEFESTARCPVLLSPSLLVTTPVAEPSFGQRAAAAWDSLRTSAAACFSSVEVGGLLSALPLLGAPSPAPEVPRLHWNIPLAERVSLAAGALKNMSLDPRSLAETVLLCGHGGQSANNPFGSSLDCGACGGHKGDVNARFAVALFNDPEVRAALQIPADTVFLAGLHNTTTDDIEIFDPGPMSTDLKSWLTAASREARRERNPGDTEKTIRRRAEDWSEVRPEWGLAGNAAFIAAPRSRTRQLNLGGRAFLHDYDWMKDHDNSVLTLILTAPVVVASWINLQYYGSTVNNELFGSGNKVIHNVVGTFGVWEGNAGDLRTGLPLQSLHDGREWRHEPLRLQVFVEAPRHRVDAVLRANPSVARLVENGWIHLVTIGDSE